ncbi:MAG: site-specific integrase [Desulfobacterales bacterium]|nr:site-specific integrase [Desulfobacterales bacterium]
MRQKLEAEISQTHITSWRMIDFANEYLSYSKERFAKKTFEEKRSAFAKLLKSVTPEMSVSDLNPSLTLTHLRKQDKGRSGNAANKDRKNLGAAWRWAQKYLQGFPLDINPFLVIEKFPEQRLPRYVPPEEDFWPVYEVANGQDKVMLLSFLHLAARRNEIFSLTWDDIDFGNRRIRLWTKKRESGNQEYDWLPMTSELFNTLMRWQEERPIKDVRNVFVCLDAIACNDELNGQPFKYRQHFMKRICMKAGVKHFGFHAIRHLTASILYREGHPVSLIQAVLRHKNPNTTSRYLRSIGLEQVRSGLEEGLKGRYKNI